MRATRRDVVMVNFYVAYFDEDLEAVNLGPARGVHGVKEVLAGAFGETGGRSKETKRDGGKASEKAGHVVNHQGAGSPASWHPSRKRQCEKPGRGC